MDPIGRSTTYVSGLFNRLVFGGYQGQDLSRRRREQGQQRDFKALQLRSSDVAIRAVVPRLARERPELSTNPTLSKRFNRGHRTEKPKAVSGSEEEVSALS